MRTTRTRLTAGIAGALAAGLTVGLGGGALTPTAAAPASDPAAAPRTAAADRPARAVLKEYAADTWRSFEAMAVPRTGLPADNIGGNLSPASRSGFTSPTNMGAMMWSTVAARDIGLISKREATRRVTKVVDSVARLERHRASGQFYNWYDPRTLEKLRVWPVDDSPVYPFLSSVDNAWLATGLKLAANAVPSVARKAERIRGRMDFGFYYNETEGPGGQIRGGFWDEEPPGCSVKDNYTDRGRDVWFTCHHYGAFNTEPRMASYLGIADGQIPSKHYYGTMRTFEDSCDWAWTEAQPVGTHRTYDGIEVFEGALRYRGMKIVPTWGGSMFEALMVPLFVPEERWGPRSWGRNHPLYVRGQIEHGLKEADYGYWGFSPSNNPAGGYREYGVDAMGLDGEGYTSDQERTDWAQPWEKCDRPGEPAPAADDYGDGVVTPHASFLSLRYARKASLRNLADLRADFDSYGRGGFFDAIATESGQVSRRYLSLDQGMVMAALGNALAGDDMRRYVATREVRQSLRPLMRQEVFASAPRP